MGDLTLVFFPGCAFCIGDLERGWRLLEYKTYQTRCAAVGRLIGQTRPLQETAFVLNLSDRPLVRNESPFTVFGPASAEGHADQAAPDFVFGGWPEAGINDYDAVAEEMRQAGQAPAQTTQLGWIGNANVHPARLRLVEIGQAHPQLMEIVNVGDWHLRGERIVQTAAPSATPNVLGMPAQAARYKYLIDVEGAGYSGRLKLLLHSGRPVLVQDRPWREYFFDDLVPWTHFVPIRRDMSDLCEAIQRLENDPALAQAIGRAGQDYARAKLTRAGAEEKWRQLITGLWHRA